MRSLHRFSVTAPSDRPILAATSASGAVPSRASYSAVQPGPDGLGMPSLQRFTLTPFGLRPVRAATCASGIIPSRRRRVRTARSRTAR